MSRQPVEDIPLTSRLSFRVGLFGTLIALLANVVSLGAVAWSMENQLVTDLETDLASDRAAVLDRLGRESQVLAVGSRAIAGQATVGALVGAEGVDVATLEAAVAGLRGNLGADTLFFVSAAGRTMASSPPGLTLDPAALARLGDAPWTATDIGDVTHLAVLEGVDVDGRRMGALVSTRALGPDFVAALVRDTRDEILVEAHGNARAAALHSVDAAALRGVTAPADRVISFASPGAALLLTEVPLAPETRILLIRNHTEAFERFGATLLGLVGLGLATLSVAGIVSALVGQRLARPIQHVTDAARRVAEGDLSEAVEQSLPDPRAVSGEARQLATSFHKMLGEVRRSRTALEAYAERLEHEVSLKASALERSKAADRAKSSFLANMSHELRTPLNAIIGYSEMLREELEDDAPGTIADLDRIHGAGTHLLALINSILDLSKIEAGKMELHLEQFDLPSLVRDVAGTVAPLAEKGENKLVIDCPPEIGVMTTDVTKVKQVLYNLLSNACKFTHGGEVQLRVRVEARHDGQDWIVLAVQDTGIGLSDDQISRLFQEFQQADSSTTRKYGGTGLGLAISRRFCEMMGGSVDVVSTLGVGTIFTVELPRHAGADDIDDSHDDTQIVRVADLEAGMEAVLIIDDDPAVRDILARSLRKDGYRVVTASSGIEALRVVHEQKFMAITLDVDMPGTDGWTVLQALKSDPKVADIPVVMITIEDDRDRGFALGAEDYLSKPIDRSRLRQVLERFRTREGGWVLVVDDEEPNRTLIARTLERLGWKVHEAHNGRMALDVLSAQGMPSAILLDLMMPEMDGFQFLRRLKDLPGGPAVPVVVLTAMDLTSETRKELSSSVASVIEKGDYSVETLVGTVRSRLAQARSLRA